MSRHPRVISLAPTQTEIVAALGYLEGLIGVTENCDYPDDVLSIPKFGSWYAPDLRKVMETRPDIVCTFGEHQEEVASALREAGLAVYHSAPATVQASLLNIEEISDLLGSGDSGLALLDDLEERLERVRQKVEALHLDERPTVLRIMNWDPLVTVGPGAFQHDVIELAGGRNVMADGPAPYFACEHVEVQSRDPLAIFYCEAFITEALRRDLRWSRVSAVKEGRLHVFDCGLTCRSGPRIVDMVEQLAKALNPEFK